MSKLPPTLAEILDERIAEHKKALAIARQKAQAFADAAKQIEGALLELGTLRAAQLPPACDLRPHMPPVEDQGELGSCVAQAVVRAMEYLDRLPDNEHEDLSRLFVYYYARAIESLIVPIALRDNGCTIRNACKAVARWGACSEAIWPYIPARVNRRPSAAARESGRIRQAIIYKRVEPSDHELCAALAAGFPVIFGMTLYESFMTAEVAKTGKVPMPARNGRAVGGHAMLLEGYTRQGWTAANSWGVSWGLGGYCFLPRSMGALFRDCWVIQQREIP